MGTNRNGPPRGGESSETELRHDQTGEFDYGLEGGQGQRFSDDRPEGTEKAEGTVPERKDPSALSTAYEYPNGDRGDKSGRNLAQQTAVSGTPGKAGGRQPTSA